MLDCAAEEIPVVAPLELAGGGTIGEYDEILYSVFPKKSGREMGLHTDEGWRRLGSLVGVLLNSIGSGLPGLLRPLGGIDSLVLLAPASLVALLGSVALLALAARTLVRRDGLG